MNLCIAGPAPAASSRYKLKTRRRGADVSTAAGGPQATALAQVAHRNSSQPPADAAAAEAAAELAAAGLLDQARLHVFVVLRMCTSRL